MFFFPLALGSGIKSFFCWLRSQIQGVLVSLALVSEPGMLTDYARAMDHRSAGFWVFYRNMSRHVEKD